MEDYKLWTKSDAEVLNQYEGAWETAAEARGTVLEHTHTHMHTQLPPYIVPSDSASSLLCSAEIYGQRFNSTWDKKTTVNQAAPGGTTPHLSTSMHTLLISLFPFLRFFSEFLFNSTRRGKVTVPCLKLSVLNTCNASFEAVFSHGIKLSRCASCKIEIDFSSNYDLKYG